MTYSSSLPSALELWVSIPVLQFQSVQTKLVQADTNYTTVSDCDNWSLTADSKGGNRHFQSILRIYK